MTESPPAADARLYPLLVAAAEYDACTLTVRMLGERGELAVPTPQIADLLAKCDGSRPIGELLEPFDEPARSVLLSTMLTLCDKGWLIDARAGYKVLQRTSRNPGPLPPTHAERDVVRWPRYQADGDRIALDARGDACAGRVPQRRGSADFTDLPRAPRTCADNAWATVRAALAVPARGAPATASAGGLRPVVTHVITQSERNARAGWYDEQHDAAVRLTELPTAALEAALPPQPEVRRALAAGAALIVLSVDVRRTCAKYGSRGYRFALIEVGSAWQMIDLEAASRNVPVRAIGGFFDERIGELLALPDWLLPQLCVLVGATHLDATELDATDPGATDLGATELDATEVGAQ
jgi:hypothetical protein